MVRFVYLLFEFVMHMKVCDVSDMSANPLYQHSRYCCKSQVIVVMWVDLVWFSCGDQEYSTIDETSR